MSAIGGKADIFCSKATLRLRRSQIAISCPLLGVKRTWAGAVQMSAFDPKRTLRQFGPFLDACLDRYDDRPEPRGGNETARVHHISWQCGGRVAAYGARATDGNASNWIPKLNV